MAITEKYASSAGAGSKDGSTEGNAWDWATMLTNAAAGDRINFKGSHTLTGNAAFSNAGTATSPIILRGYASTIGDGYQGRTNGNGPLLTTNMAALSGAYSITMPAFSIFEALNITGTRNGSFVPAGQHSAMVRCVVSNSSTGTSASCYAGTTYSLAWDSDFIMTGGSGGLYAAYVTTGYIIACRVDGGSAIGISMGSIGIVIGCTVYSAGSDAIYSSTTNNNSLVYGCTVVTSGSDGVHQVTGATRLLCLLNNILADNGQYGIYAVDAETGIFAASNRIDRNTSGASNGATDWLAASGYNNNTTSATQANEFPGYASDDYRLGPTSPARQNGIPSYLDIGALQRIEDYPAVGNVTADDTVDGSTGTYHEAAASEVQSGVQFGAGGTEYTGTLSGGSGIWMPRPRQIGV